MSKAVVEAPWIARELRRLARPVAELREDPRNARRHPDANLRAIEASLRAHGQRKPVVVRDGLVLAGNGTLAVARDRLGWTHLAAVEYEGPEAEARAFALADNRAGELASWDPDALEEALAEARRFDAYGATGFAEADLDAVLDQAREAAAGLAAATASGPVEERPGDADLEPGDAPDPGDDSDGARLARLLRPAGLAAPFPWFGGKRRVAGIVWAALGNPVLYVEPFAGSLATLLCRPAEHLAGEVTRHEHVNDLDAYVANFWRATAADPDAVAAAADWPVSEADLLARHRWLVAQGAVRDRVRDDPDFYDAKVAGWWVWGLSSWIGSGWCSGVDHDKLPHLRGDRGVTAQLPHLGSEQGVTAALRARFGALRDRLRRVRVCCGSWDRVLTLGATAVGGDGPGAVGVFLDPPYDTALRADRCYAVGEAAAGRGLSGDVRRWAVDHGDDPRFRIVLTGYEAEHEAEIPASWRRVAWTSRGSYQTRRSAAAADTRGLANRDQERLWLSPHCLSLPAVREASS